MSIESEILRLQSDSAAIANAIAAKGVTVPAGSGYDDYAGLISSIPSGGTDLPSGYSRVWYVSTNSSAYVDTGISGATDLEIVVEFLIGNYIQYGAIYGNYIDESHKCNRAILSGSSFFFVAGGNNLAENTGYYSVDKTGLLRVTSSYANLNGTETAIASSSQAANTNKICLGNRSLTNTATRDIGLRIYYFRIKKNGVKVLEYIPCVRDSDSVAGFYNTVSSSFVRSSTSVDFSAGLVI